MKTEIIKKVNKSYTAQYKDPVILNKGDIVKLGEEEMEEKWKGWIWSISIDNEGWIPKQIIEISRNGKRGTVKEFYTAKELNVSEGDVVTILKTLNGWSWVRENKTGEEGWIPDENIFQ